MTPLSMDPPPLAQAEQKLKILITVVVMIINKLDQKRAYIYSNLSPYHPYTHIFTSHPFHVGVILFFKVRDRVKKAVFTGKNLDDLNKLFMEKYPDFPR